MRLQAGEPLKRVARVFAVSAHTARKWRARYQADGEAGLADRSSRHHTVPASRPPALQLAAKVLRRQQWTCEQIGAALEVSAATVARVLRRCGLSRRGRLTAPLVAQRYEHAAVGDLLHWHKRNPSVRAAATG
jgi:transposase